MAKKQKDLQSSDSESDAPEAVHLGAARGDALERERAVKEFHAEAAKKRKDTNKAREEARKVAAEDGRRKTRPTVSQRQVASTSQAVALPDEDDDETEDESPEDLRLRKRMEAAMQQAEEEDELDNSDEDEFEEALDAVSASSNSESDSELEPASDSEIDEAPEPVSSRKRPRPSKSSGTHPSASSPAAGPSKPKNVANYLPESTFAAVKAARQAAQAKAEALEKRRALKKLPERKKKATKPAKSSPKDVVIGSRIVRALAPVKHKRPAPPSKSLTEFERDARRKGNRRIERRPVNLTVGRGAHGVPRQFKRH